jgi:hypothetical protein
MWKSVVLSYILQGIRIRSSLKAKEILGYNCLRFEFSPSLEVSRRYKSEDISAVIETMKI